MYLRSMLTLSCNKRLMLRKIKAVGIINKSVEIIVTGENEQAVLDEFVKMFEDGFGE